MLVLSAIKNVKEDIRNRLEADFPELDFSFCHGIEEAKAELPEAEIFITYGEDLSDELIKQAKNLKWIMVLSAGMEKMPFSQIDKQGILVTNARGIHAIPMAEYTFTMLLQAARQGKKVIAHEQAHIWDRKVVMNEITGKTLVVLGTGAIGQETARLAQAFRMRTIGVSKTGKLKPYFDETHPSDNWKHVLSKADFVVAVMPSTPETIEFVKPEHFEKMPAHSIFLNMGRGDLVKTETVLEAVRNGEIAHAVLDVFEEEPLPEDHVLWEEENITVTPHVSGVSPQYQYRGFDIFSDNLERYLQGQEEFINKIDPKRGY
ncbi:glycerate dehydrogenase [Thalassobacillus devorans]|uniref:Glycerate dehydrogenase n=1 Tax=Thalassobacillus devorans TaxID=279813 RepID=A0ABQ1PT52_9BACI|nr:D-2-hydroxyacid dehydrogenase [Thalassobacillus devorans]NIK30491.1 phosphoglycerate dehydrogenase-like enzyme [Thalassobacillus devorans]GGD02476.1 glycerate dehydrogenase [Thalassobacillus devorans]